MHIYSRNIVTDEASFDIVIFLMTVLKDRREDGRMEFFNFRPPARPDAAPVCKIGIFCEHRRKSVRTSCRFHASTNLSINSRIAF